MIKEKRLLYSQESFFEKSKIIQKKVLQHPLYQKASMLGIYVSLPQEVDTRLLIEKALQHHRVCVPRVEGKVMHFYEIHSLKELKDGHFHVLEPTTNEYIKPEEIDFMIIPMLAFDESYHRVGYGKGYYDQYLVSGFHGYKLGLAFSFQYVRHIEFDEYDQVLDEILTE